MYRHFKDRKIAYFSMEIGLNPDMPTYSGGLGVLAGDTIKSCADLKVPIVAVTLLYRKGYFQQKIDVEGNQQEFPDKWSIEKFLKPLHVRTKVKIEARDVVIGAWLYEVVGIEGYIVPVIFLDTNLKENSDYDKTLTDYLYQGDQRYRLAQEIVLGIGGLRMLESLGCTKIKKYHMNEGHSSLLTLELLHRLKTTKEQQWNTEGVRELCVFTTHTPVPAGHDKFPYSLVKSVLGDFIPEDILKSLGGEENLNMTQLALNLSKYINGVAKKHGEVTSEMFPGYTIDSITNGIHLSTWVSPAFKKLYDKYIPGWQSDYFSLRYALSIPKEEILDAHREAKKELIDYVNAKTSIGMDYETFTIGFARRATQYKRADLLLTDTNRLTEINNKAGKIQIIYAGKAHPKDEGGKKLIKKIFSKIKELCPEIKIVYLENYDMTQAKLITSGVDLWLNTPLPPQEASGTSGMKASLNGVPNLSILDGWWIEGCIENVTGWAINSLQHQDRDNIHDAMELYWKLEKIIIPMFYLNKNKWAEIMRYAIALNASFFNTQRMVQEYVLNAYL